MNRAADKAMQTGAFGGSRQGIQTAEIERNILDAKRKATADLRAKTSHRLRKPCKQVTCWWYRSVLWHYGDSSC